jgi:hypothetical protein
MSSTAPCWVLGGWVSGLCWVLGSQEVCRVDVAGRAVAFQIVLQPFANQTTDRTKGTCVGAWVLSLGASWAVRFYLPAFFVRVSVRYRRLIFRSAV